MKEEKGVFSLLAKPVRALVEERGFILPTTPQERAIPLVASGENILLVAPTGTGKTEAAFLPILNTLFLERGTSSGPGIKALYITPLRSLNRDLLERLEWWAKKLDVRLGVRHGDTEVRDRGRQSITPPDLLITTPETLQAILTGKVLRRHLKSLRWVIVDEVHELAEDKRGSQLSIGLQRLQEIVSTDLQLIGLSATIGSPDEIAKFLVGEGRRCSIAKVSVPRDMEVEILYPKAGDEDSELSSKLYTYPDAAARLRAIRSIVEEHRSSLIFTNTRSEAEILANRFRMWDPSFPIAVHHSSLSKPTRVSAERDLKDGKLAGIICTSSLEMGIDVGILDMVVQYNSPRQVTRLIQRVGRSGHRVGGLAKGVIITQDPDDTLESIVIAKRALAEELEPVLIPKKPLDVLVHQIAGLLFYKSRWAIAEAVEYLSRAYPYRDLTGDELMEALQYMHDRNPRLAWFSKPNRMFARPMIIKSLYDYYFENLSMIPDERQYLVLKEDETPVGVLDEAFVAEHGQVGTKFVEAGMVWKIVQVYEDKVYVNEEDDPTGSIPTWVGDEIPVPYEIAQEVGRIRREVAEKIQQGYDLGTITKELSSRYPIDRGTLERALQEVREHLTIGLPIPTDETITVERWEDYVIIQCCFGHLVNRTMARILALQSSEIVGQSIPVHQDPYRIVLKTGTIGTDIVVGLLRKFHGSVDDLAIRSLVVSGTFRRRMIHVAKKFGAISKEAELTSSRLQNLIEAVKGTAIFREAVNSVLHMDSDLERTREVARMIYDGKIRVLASESTQLTPIAKIGMETIARKSDIVRPERIRKLILESVRARILSEGVTIICTNCWKSIDTIKVRSFVKGWECPCGNVKAGITHENQEKVEFLAERVRVGGEVPKRFRRLYKEIQGSSNIISSHGFPGIFALCGRSLRTSDALEILKIEPNYNDTLIELVIQKEKEAMKRRFMITPRKA